MDRFSNTLVYVVDDDHDDFEILNDVIVERWPTMRFEHFEDPNHFVNCLDTLAHPCFIVLDVNMPKINGFEVLTSLKENVRWKKIPVIFLSTANSTAHQQKALELGAVSYLVKPSTSEQWANVVEEIRELQVKQDC